MELVIYLKNEEDLAVLEPLLKRLQLRFERKNSDHNTLLPLAEQKLEAARVQLLQMLQAGVDVSTYGDPVEWQQATRTDNNLPFRD
jgi:hypothetical protein